MNPYKRVQYNLNVPEDSSSNVPGMKYSKFLITINPNLFFESRNDPGFIELANKLGKIGHDMLKEKNILNLLVFGNDRSRAHNLSMIQEIHPERYSRVELGIDKHRLHVHIVFSISHYTILQINQASLRKAVSDELNMPPTLWKDPKTGKEKLKYPFHVDIKVDWKRSIDDYVRKYDKYNT